MLIVRQLQRQAEMFEAHQREFIELQVTAEGPKHCDTASNILGDGGTANERQYATKLRCPLLRKSTY